MSEQNGHTLLRLSGYASLFGQTDLSGDRVEKGAFAASILSLPEGRLPLLFGHNTEEPIGVWDRVIEDQKGLFVSGCLFAGAALNHRVARLIKEGAISGLSIGYRARRHSKTAQGRLLTELELWEVSVVAFPMLRDARVTHIDDLSFSNSSQTIKGNQAYG